MKNKVDDRGWTEEVMLEFGVFFGVAHRLLSTVQPKIPWFSSRSFLLFDRSDRIVRGNGPPFPACSISSFFARCSPRYLRSVASVIKK